MYKYKTNRTINAADQNNSFAIGQKYGEQCRKEFGLDAIDNDPTMAVVFILPRNVIYLTDSFFQGLLMPSLKKNGIESRLDKYTFQIECDSARDAIEINIETCWCYLYHVSMSPDERCNNIFLKKN